MPTSTEALLPGLIIAGVQKAATSSLWNYLVEHPGVAGSAVKEPGYWAPLRFSDGTLAPLSDYHALWKGTDPAALRMEATVRYFYGGRRLASAIDEACPGVRVLIVLREPSSRLLSWLRFQQSMVHLPVELTLRDYVERSMNLTPQELDDFEQRYWFGVEGGLYAELMAEWLDVFGDRLRVAWFDDVVGDPRLVLADVCGWLGLDLDAIPDLPLNPKNLTVGYRNAGLQRLALRVNEVGDKFFTRHPAVKTPILNAYRRINGAPVTRETDPDEATVLAEMKTWYAERNAGLRELLETHGAAARIPAWVT